MRTDGLVLIWKRDPDQAEEHTLSANNRSSAKNFTTNDNFKYFLHLALVLFILISCLFPFLLGYGSRLLTGINPILDVTRNTTKYIRTY